LTIVLFGLLSTSPINAQLVTKELTFDSAEEFAEVYFEVFTGGDWQKCAELTHPEAQTDFREHFMPIITMAEESGALPQLGPVIGISSLEDAKFMSDTDFLGRIMGNIMNNMGAGQMLAQATSDVLGAVTEGDTLAHVVYRMINTVSGTEFEKVDLLSLKKSEGHWRAMLSGDIEGIGQRLMQMMRSAAPPAKEP
jgi:hypothetical protein